VVDGQEAVSLSIEVPQKTLIQLQRTLNRIDPELKKTLARDLKTALLGPAAKVVADFSGIIGGRPSPMSGMDARWGRVKASVKTYPTPRDGRAIAIIGIAGEDKGFNRTVAITERAGSRTKGLTRAGMTMIRVLQERYPLVGRGGRFIWRS
jgi:hypothetical protein